MGITVNTTKIIRLKHFLFDVDTGDLSLESQVTRLSPKAASVLLLLCEHSGAVVTRHQLHESVWSDRIVTDVQVSKAVNELRVALQDTSEPRQYIETLPKRGYRLICDIDFQTSSTKPGDLKPQSFLFQKKWRIGAAFLVALTLIAILSSLFFRQPSEIDITTTTQKVEMKPGIAVLPFVNISSDPNNDYFSQGIAEEILTRLSRLDGLRVISRTSSFQFNDDKIDARQIGKILTVSHVLEGSVQKTKGRVRINIRLIETKGGSEVSSLQYDRDLDEIFDLQTEIAKTVTQTISPSLLTLNPNTLANYGTTNISAYEEYLKGRYLLINRERVEMKEASAAFEKAVQYDPAYLLAHSGLVDSYLLRVLWGTILPEVYYTNTADSISILESSSANFPEILATLGFVNRMTQNIPKAIDYLQRALASNPQYLQAYLWLQDVYLLADPPRSSEAINLLKTARLIDPLSTVVISMLSRAYRENGDFRLSKKTTDDVLELDPTSYIGRLGLAKHYRWVEGDLVKAAQVFYNMWIDRPEFTTARSIGQIFTDLGEFDLAAIWLQRAAEIVPASFGPELQFRWLLAQEKSDEIIGLVEASSEIEIPAIIGNYKEILEGNFEKATLLLNMRKQRIDGSPTATDEADTLLVKGYLAKKLGEKNQLNRIIKQLESKLYDKQLLGENEVGLQLTRLYILQDKQSEAIKILRKTFETRAINHFSSRHSVFFDSLRDNPDFRKLQNEIELYFAQQRERLREYPDILPSYSADQLHFPDTTPPTTI